MSPKEQGPDGLNVCSWVQRRIHLQVYKTCSHRNVQLLLDCSHLQGTGSECCWFMASHSLRSVFVYVCEGGKKRRHGSILGSTLYIVPSGSGAHAAQPSCDLHASAAAWLCLSPAELFQHGPVLPRLCMPHAFIPFFSRLFVTHNGRCKTVLLSVGETSWKLLPYATHTHTLTEGKSSNTLELPLFFFFSSSHLTFNHLLESKHKSPETQQSYQESTSVLQMPIALERLFSTAPPLLTKTFLTSPLLFLFGCSK